jgi:hypothetical protein
MCGSGVAGSNKKWVVIGRFYQTEGRNHLGTIQGALLRIKSKKRKKALFRLVDNGMASGDMRISEFSREPETCA